MRGPFELFRPIWYNGEVRDISFRNNFMTEAYCVKCRAKRQMKDAKEVSFKGKGDKERRAMSGLCEVCGTKMFRILASAKAA